MDAIGNERFLQAHSVCRSFKTSEGLLEVLKGVNLEVSKGSMVAITGESGVGKSTLLHILGGLDRPTKGSIDIDNEPLADKNESELAAYRNRKIGFVFQHHYLLEDFTALENVMIPALIIGKAKSEAEHISELLLNDVGLNDRKTHRPNQLSGGEQQRVAVARALVNDPGIVLADEPSGNLDIKTGERLHGLLNDLNKARATTILVATHNRDLAASCDRTIMLVDGCLTEAAES